MPPRAARKLVLLAVGGLLTTAAVWMACRAACVHSHFALRGIDIVGADQTVAAAVRVLAGVRAGTNTWDVDLNAVRERVRTNPWVADVRVNRRLPDGLVVAVRERLAYAVLRTPVALYAVDRRGRLIAPVKPSAAVGLPRITGVSAADVNPNDSSARARLGRAVTLIRVLERRHVTAVRIDRAAGLYVWIESMGDVPIRFGWGGWRAKRRRLNAVLRLWEGEEARLRSLDVGFADQVIVRLRAGGGTRRPAV